MISEHKVSVMEGREVTVCVRKSLLLCHIGGLGAKLTLLEAMGLPNEY